MRRLNPWKYLAIFVLVLHQSQAANGQQASETLETEGERKIQYSYHGLLIGKDGKIISDASEEEIAEFWQRYENENFVRRQQEREELELFLSNPIQEIPDRPEGLISMMPAPKILNPAPPPIPAPPAVPASASAYVKDCDSKKVPIPPPWGDPQWRKQRNLPPKYVAAGSPTDRTEIWTYQNTNGICVALPRIRTNPPPDELQLLGIICQSKKTEYACFWDNIDLGGNRITGAAMIGKGPSKLKDGNNLNENCTNCHRGVNVFNVYPGTDLSLEPIGTGFGGSADRYKPVSSQTTWGNPPRTIKPLGDCTQCHELPALTIDYCRTVLKKSLGPTPPGETPPPPTMPPPPDKWNDPDYKNEVILLQNACYKLDPNRTDPAKRKKELDFGLGIPWPPP